MCTHWRGPVHGNAAGIRQRVALRILGRSLVQRQFAFAQASGWHDLDVVQTVGDDDANDLGILKPDGSASPALIVFRRAGHQVRLFWASAMRLDMAGPGHGPPDAPDTASRWSARNLTPERPGADWYARLRH